MLLYGLGMLQCFAIAAASGFALLAQCGHVGNGYLNLKSEFGTTNGHESTRMRIHK